MARETYIVCRETGAFIPKAQFLRARVSVARSDFPRPRIKSDSITPGQSQLDGRMYDSMSAYQRSIRDYEARTGKQVEIVGDQVHHLMKDEPEVADEKAIDTAIKEALERHDA